jgi:hypothetical protein
MNRAPQRGWREHLGGVDTYQLDLQYGAAARSPGIDAAGNFYVVGQANNKPRGSVAYSHWIVQKMASGQNSQAPAIVADCCGDIFAAGYGWGASGKQHWIVRRTSVTPPPQAE